MKIDKIVPDGTTPVGATGGDVSDAALPAENIRRIMAHATEVVLFDGPDDDDLTEDTEQVSLDDLDKHKTKFGTPYIDLRNEDMLVQVLVRAARPGERPSATLEGPDGSLHIFVLQEPTSLPEGNLDSLPSPQEVCWAEDELFFTLEDGEPVLAPVELNASLIVGTETDGFNSALTRDCEVLIGSMYGAHNKRNTQDGEWTALKMPLIDLIRGFDAAGDAPEFGFSRHTPARKKEGPCVVMGSSIDGARKAKAMKTMHFIGIDIDSGARMDDVITTIKRKKIFCLFHTSFNHGKRGLHLKRDEVLRKLGIKTDPTLDQVKEYLRLHDKNRYEEAFIQDVTIKKKSEQVKDGVVIVLDTPPLDKMRLFFPLAEPVDIVDLAETHQDALDDWENTVTGLAHSVLGCHFDTSCTDPSRLFFTPRHPKGDENWESLIIMGDPLKYEDIPRVKKAQYTKNRDLNAFVQADDSEGPGKVKSVFLPSGDDLTKWHSKVGKSRFMLADLLETMCPDKIRVAGGEKSGHVHTECPFEHEHTSEGGTGTMAINALDNSSEYWTWFCHHDACQSRHKTEFLGEAINRGWFDEDLLVSDEFLMPPADDEDDTAREGMLLEKETGTTAEEITADAVSRWNTDTIEKDVEEHFAKRIAAGADQSVLNKDKEAIATATSLGKRDVSRIIKQERIKFKDKKKKDASKKANRDLKAGIVPKDCWTKIHDFSWQKEYAVVLITNQNVKKHGPVVFSNGNVLARIDKEEKTGRAEIVDLSADALVTFLTDHGRFMELIDQDGMSRQVECPKQIAVQIINEWKKTRYPELEGIIAAPQFAEDGSLVAVAGYHEGSGLYYAPPNGFEVAAVPDVPTPDELAAAVDLWRDLFADFPFENMTREKIMAGEASADFAHLMGLALTTPARDLMGQSAIVPAFLATKPSPGTGATLMLQILQMVLFGSTSIDAPEPNDTELHKTVFADLMQGKALKVWDNVESVGGQVYPALLTAPEYSGRVLGHSLTKTIRNRMCLGFTGNNVEFTKELRRRLVLCRLDAKMEKPELRAPETFDKPNVLEYARDNRGEYYHALLVIIQNWIAKDYPVAPDAKRLASYENWSDDIGGILHSAGIFGFLGNRDKVDEYTSGGGDDDPIKELIECWLAATMKGEDKNPRVTRVGMLCKQNAASRGNIGLIDIAVINELTLPVKLSRHADSAFGYASDAFGAFLAKGVGRVFEIEGDKWALQKGVKTNQGLQWSLVQITA